jgi:hypothetical protein
MSEAIQASMTAAVEKRIYLTSWLGWIPDRLDDTKGEAGHCRAGHCRCIFLLTTLGRRNAAPRPSADIAIFRSLEYPRQHFAASPHRVQRNPSMMVEDERCERNNQDVQRSRLDDTVSYYLKGKKSENIVRVQALPPSRARCIACPRNARHLQLRRLHLS